MEHEQRRTCDNCRWFQRVTYYGDCRRHAPMPASGPEANYMLNPERKFPVMNPLDWCGDYEPIPIERRERE